MVSIRWGLPATAASRLLAQRIETTFFCEATGAAIPTSTYVLVSTAGSWLADNGTIATSKASVCHETSYPERAERQERAGFRHLPLFHAGHLRPPEYNGIPAPSLFDSVRSRDTCNSNRKRGIGRADQCALRLPDAGADPFKRG